MMQPLPEDKKLNGWGRLARWVSQIKPVASSGCLTIGLVIFLIFLPASIRIVLWHGLQSHKILAGLLLVFGLLAISLVWSSGQRLDVWIFLLF